MLKYATRTAIVMMLFALVFTAGMAFIHQVTEADIEKSEAEMRLALFREILPQNLYDNALLQDVIEVAPDPLLGNTLPTQVIRARLNHQPSALILEAIAHDGYSGDIKLLIAVKADGSVSGVRVLAHKETPGLGDYIEVVRSRWITQFDGKAQSSDHAADWAVKKDGGQFDYMVGATITPRAVVKAVHHALQYVETHRDQLFQSPALAAGSNP